ncbi:MAG: 16S rRNA (cytosine(1402)-N(4))-methyltransferase RsmH [Clostridia bacterium]|nr:16S rRNA (cytosine(1402)-N(4))-methyltransferase RsmH [Clostridia bacterium]
MNNDLPGSFNHVPVMLGECIDALGVDSRPDGVFIDCTAGGGGHSFEIARRLKGGRLISIDRDPDAVRAVSDRLACFGSTVTVVHENFVNLPAVMRDLNIARADGILMDLGVSSYQLDSAERGFSYMKDAFLDMRMDRSTGISAYDVINGYPEEDLARIFYEYGEERYASKIASLIADARSRKKIETTSELSDIVCSAYPKGYKEGHPAKRVFQAVRIEVNGELDILQDSVRNAVNALNTGGVIAVITFHSLEDRIVKKTFAELAKGCTCPPDFPVCVCGKKPVIDLTNRKPVLPSMNEQETNPRSKSAKLRSAIKI